MPSHLRHAKRSDGSWVQVDDRFTPPFANDPANVIRTKPARFLNTVEYLVEWATGEREWVIEWAVHEPGWEPKTGVGCPCGRQSLLYTPKAMQI